MHPAKPSNREALHRASLLLVGLALATSLWGCTRHATQLMLVIQTDLDSASYACIGIEVARLTDGIAVTPTQYVSFSVPAQASVPFSLGVLPPSGDASLRVEIRTEARGGRCDDPNTTTSIPPPVVRTVVRAGFAPEQTLRLPIFLAARCTGVSCSEGNSCNPDTGLCEPVMEKLPEDLTPIRPGEELSDGSVSDAPAPSDAGAPAMLDANLTGGQCPLEIGDFTMLADAPPRVFGLAITQPGNEWVVLYSDAGSLHAIRYPYDSYMESQALAWEVSPGADGIALEGLTTGNRLIALVNPAGSTDLVRYVGPIEGTAPVATTLGTGRLVQRGRHSVLFGERIATVVERGAGVAVIAVGATDNQQDVFVSASPVDIALGNTATGDLMVAISGTACEVRTFDTSGVMMATEKVPTVETSLARAVTRLDDGHIALVHANSTQLRLNLSTTPTDGMSLRLNPGAHVPVVAAILGHDATYRVAWSDVYDYPAPPEPGPEEPGIIYQTSFGVGETISEYTDHGDATTDHDLTRWERSGNRSALVMVPRNGFSFRSVCRPTPE